MTEIETQWIGEKPPDPFEGIMVVLNMGESCEPCEEYVESIRDAHNEAVADGLLVAHLYERGVEPSPWYLSSPEDMSLRAPLAKYTGGRTDLSFALDPAERTSQLRAVVLTVVKYLHALGDYRFSGSRMIIAGRVDVDGVEVFMPPTELK